MVAPGVVRGRTGLGSGTMDRQPGTWSMPVPERRLRCMTERNPVEPTPLEIAEVQLASMLNQAGPGLADDRERGRYREEAAAAALVSLARSLHEINRKLDR